MENKSAVATCKPVATVTDLRPGAAAGSIVNCAVAVVGLVTVTSPGLPCAADPTDTPAPNDAVVLP